MQVVGAIVLNSNTSTLFGVVQKHAGCQAMGENVLEVLEGGRKFRLIRPIATRRRFVEPRKLLNGELFGSADRRSLPDDHLGQKLLLFMGFQGEQNFGVAYRDAAGFEQRLGIGIEIDEPHRIGD